MIVSVSSQAAILLASLYGGLILGIFYDIYRLIKNGLKFSRPTTAIGDIFFWLVGLTVTLVVIYKSSSGLVRFYQLIGFSIGMVIYLKILSRYVNRILRVLFYSIRNIIYSLFGVARIPFIIISNLLWKPYNKSKTWLEKVLGRIIGEAGRYLALLRKKK